MPRGVGLPLKRVDIPLSVVLGKSWSQGRKWGRGRETVDGERSIPASFGAELPSVLWRTLEVKQSLVCRVPREGLSLWHLSAAPSTEVISSCV